VSGLNQWFAKPPYG